MRLRSKYHKTNRASETFSGVSGAFYMLRGTKWGINLEEPLL